MKDMNYSKFTNAILLSVIVLVSCQKNTNEGLILSEDKQPVSSFHLMIEDQNSETKVSAEIVSGHFVWFQGDEVSVFDEQDNNIKFKTDSPGTTSQLLIAGAASITPGDYAVYPYSNNASVSGNSVTFDLPTSYDITYLDEWQYYMPMLGKIDAVNNVIKFKSVGAVLDITVYDVPETATQVTFTAPNNKITGLFTITDATATNPQITTSESVGGDNTITISFVWHKNMSFHIPVPVGSINGFSLSFNDSSNTTKTVSRTVDVSRNQIIITPSLNLGSDSVWDSHPFVAETDRITMLVYNGYPFNTIYKFEYDDNSRLTKVSSDSQDICTFTYSGEDIVYYDLVNSESETYRKVKNTLWVKSSSSSSWEPIFSYNYDGTMENMWGNSWFDYRDPSTYRIRIANDCVWDSIHNVTNLLGKTISYSSDANVWSGVSLSAFIFGTLDTWGPRSINDYITHMHTANVLQTFDTPFGQTTLSAEYDAAGRMVTCILSGGLLDGENFLALYGGDEEYGIGPLSENLANGATSGEINVCGAVVSMVYGNRAWIEDETGSVLMYKSGHGLETNNRITGKMVYAGTLYKGMPELTDFSNATVITTDFAGGEKNSIYYGIDIDSLDKIDPAAHMNRLLHLKDITVEGGFTGMSGSRSCSIKDSKGNTFTIMNSNAGHTGQALKDGDHFDNLWVILTKDSSLGNVLYYFGDPSKSRE